LRQEIIPVSDVTDPLEALTTIVGRALQEEKEATSNDKGIDDGEIHKPEQLVEDIPFNGVGLEDFLHGRTEAADSGNDEEDIAQTAEECEYVCTTQVRLFRFLSPTR